MAKKKKETQPKPKPKKEEQVMDGLDISFEDAMKFLSQPKKDK